MFVFGPAPLSDRGRFPCADIWRPLLAWPDQSTAPMARHSTAQPWPRPRHSDADKAAPQAHPFAVPDLLHPTATGFRPCHQSSPPKGQSIISGLSSRYFWKTQIHRNLYRWWPLPHRSSPGPAHICHSAETDSRQSPPAPHQPCHR